MKYIKKLKSSFIKQSLRLYARDLTSPIDPRSAITHLDIREGNTKAQLKGISCNQLTRRLAQNGRLFVAYHNKMPAGYIFASVSSCMVEEVKKIIYLAPGECYLYDAYTYPAYRGQGIYPALLDYAVLYFKTRSFLHAIIFSLSQNRASIRGINKAGFRCYGSIEFFSIFGYKFWRYSTKNGYIKSHFNDQ